jgi:HEAT repeat protein
MRWDRAWLAALTLVIAGPAVHSNPLARTQLEQELSGFDYLPSRATLDTMLGGDLSGLLVVATTTDDPEVTTGMRVRAYRALGQFDADLARNALTAAIVANRDSDAPHARMLLIAAIEGLGAIGSDAAVTVLASTLGNDSRDVRAAAALALGDTASPDACSPLRGQNTHETNPQVRAALQAALLRIDLLCSAGVTPD